MAAKYKKLYRSNTDRLLAGVCGGLGEYFEMDPTLIRVLFVVGIFLTGGTIVLAYLIMMFIIPAEPTISR